MLSRYLVLGALGAFALGAAGARAEIAERVLAAVDERPVFLSDVRAIEQVDGVPRAEALERAIDETLVFREAFHLPQAAVGPAEEEGALPGQTGVLEDPVLHRLAHRRALVRKYALFRFRPQVRVEYERVRRAYEEEWGGRAGAPSYESVAGTLRERLAAEEVQTHLLAWVRELRAAARIRYNRPE